MPLTGTQPATLKAHIAGNSATVSINGTPTAISAVPVGGQNAQTVADWYNQAASPAYLVWNPATPIRAIRAAIDMGKYTPADIPPASTNTITGTNDALLYQNRALKMQLQQANAMFFLQGDGVVDCSPQSFRLLFNDCLTGIPSGTAGANQNAGWGTGAAPGNVKLAMQRQATNAEKLFSAVGATVSGTATASGNVLADARGGATNPDALVVAGAVSADDVLAAWAS